MFESENKLLVSEIAQLREVRVFAEKRASSKMDFQDMRKLEDTFEQTLTREEQELAAEVPSDGDAASLQKSMREVKTKYEVCVLFR